MPGTATSSSTARGVHLLVAMVALVALVLQLVLVIDGAATLLPEAQPSLGTRLVRFVSYFTILSNLLVLVTSALLARDPGRDGRHFRVVRLDAVVCIAVTGVVHWFALRPLLDLDGASYVADKLLHVAVPLLATAAWVWVGPRERSTRAELLPALVLPVAWLAWTLLAGAVTGWYPYPFLDVAELGYDRVLANCAGVAALLVVACLGAIAADRRLSRG